MGASDLDPTRAGLDALASPAHHAFTARLPDAVVGILLPAPTAAAGAAPGLVAPGRATLEAALALARAEPWLTRLEDWLGAGLSPLPVAPSASKEPEGERGGRTRGGPRLGQHAVLFHETLRIGLQLPLAVLAGLGRPLPEAFAEWRWRPVSCDLVLDAMALSEGDARQLRPGALLLLPASFTAAWQARLQPEGGEGGFFGARLQEARGRLCVSPTGEPVQPAGNDHAAVRFTARVAVRAPDLLGWTAGKPAAIDVPALLSPAGVVVHATPLQSQRVLATGQLMPVGSGYGVRIESTVDAPSGDTSPVASAQS